MDINEVHQRCVDRFRESQSGSRPRENVFLRRIRPYFRYSEQQNTEYIPHTVVYSEYFWNILTFHQMPPKVHPYLHFTITEDDLAPFAETISGSDVVKSL
jgi:hypothetical protein